MHEPASPARHLRFGAFDLNLHTGELHKGRTRLRVPDQSIEILKALLEQPGQLVTREELRDRLWSSDTFVDFEHGMNAAVRRLREALGDSADVPKYIETLPRRGYRFIGAIEGAAVSAAAVVSQAGAVEPVTLEAVASNPVGDARHWNRTAVVVASVVALLVIAMAAVPVLWRQSRAVQPGPGADRQIRAIAVLPFRQLSPSPADEWLADAIPEALISALGQLDGFQRVIALESARRYRGSGLSVRDIGKELQVEGIVTGTLARDGDRLRIFVELIDAGTERQIWEDTYRRAAHDLLDVQHQVVRAIVREVRISVTPHQRLRLDAPARRADPEALALLFKARAARRVIKFRETVRYCELAIERDPDMAAAWAELATTLVFQAYGNPALTVIPRARAAVDRALQLDPESGLARAALGRIRMHVDWDWEGAGRELRSAVALEPHNPDVRWQHGFYLGTMGRFDESVQEMRESLRLDPKSASPHFQLGFALRMARQYGAAVDAISRAVELEPDTPFFRAQRGFTRALNGECDLALADLAAAGPSQFDGYVAARCGAPERARRLAAETPRDRRCPWQVYAALRDFDAAFACLEEQFAKRDFALAQIATEPWSANLLADPRFDQLLRRMGYPR